MKMKIGENYVDGGKRIITWVPVLNILQKAHTHNNWLITEEEFAEKIKANECKLKMLTFIMGEKTFFILYKNQTK